MFGGNWDKAIASAISTGLAERTLSYSTGREGKNKAFPKAIRLHRRHMSGRAKQYKLERAVAKRTNHTLITSWNVACPVACRIRFNGPGGARALLVLLVLLVLLLVALLVLVLDSLLEAGKAPWFQAAGHLGKTDRLVYSQWRFPESPAHKLACATVRLTLFRVLRFPRGPTR